MGRHEIDLIRAPRAPSFSHDVAPLVAAEAIGMKGHIETQFRQPFIRVLGRLGNLLHAISVARRDRIGFPLNRNLDRLFAGQLALVGQERAAGYLG